MSKSLKKRLDEQQREHAANMACLVWIKELSALLQRAPKGIWLFAASGNLHVLALDKNGKRVETESGGMDSNEIISTIQKARHLQVDGGAW